MSPITSQIAFVDYENFPSFFEGRNLRNYTTVYLFTGCQQKNLPIRLVKELLPIGEKVKIICIGNQSKNNLDFHLILYIGQLDATTSDKQCEFTIFSNDTGYDDVINHLRKEFNRPIKRVMNARK